MSPETNKPRKRQRYCENEEEVEDQHNSSQSETESSFSDTFNLLQSTIANLCSLLKRKDEKIMLLEQQQQKEEQKNNYQNELPSIGNMEKTDSLLQKEEEIRALQIKVSHLESTIQKEKTLRKEHEDLLFSQSAKLTEATRQQQLQQQNNQTTTAVLFREEISRLQLELNQEKEKYQNVVLTCTQLKEALRKKTQKSDAADLLELKLKRETEKCQNMEIECNRLREVLSHKTRNADVSESHEQENYSLISIKEEDMSYDNSSFKHRNYSEERGEGGPGFLTQQVNTYAFKHKNEEDDESANRLRELLTKIRQALERSVLKHIQKNIQYLPTSPPSGTGLKSLIDLLSNIKERPFPMKLLEAMHTIRAYGNMAVHDGRLPSREQVEKDFNTFKRLEEDFEIRYNGRLGVY